MGFVFDENWISTGCRKTRFVLRENLSFEKRRVVCLVETGFQLYVKKYRVLCLVKIGFQLHVEQIGFCLFWGKLELKIKLVLCLVKAGFQLDAEKTGFALWEK